MSNNINIKNKKASFEYEFIEKYVAGIQITGTEIKSIREGKASLVDAYCIFNNHELYLKNMHIAEYSLGTCNNHIPKRDRKLLLNRREINKWEKKVKQKGLTIIAIRLFVNNKNLAKVEIALSRGKQSYDKRESIKQKDTKRELDRLRKL